jgi:hypothetical protein
VRGEHDGRGGLGDGGRVWEDLDLRGGHGETVNARWGKINECREPGARLSPAAPLRARTPALPAGTILAHEPKGPLENGDDGGGVFRGRGGGGGGSGV